MEKEYAVTIMDGDQQLDFVIRKMRPMQLERWLTRTLKLMVKDKDADQDEYKSVAQKLARGSVFTLVQYSSAEEVLTLCEELMSCCFYRTEDGEVPCTRENIDDIIQEVRTLVLLKNQALTLNLAFLLYEENMPQMAAFEAPDFFSPLPRLLPQV